MLAPGQKLVGKEIAEELRNIAALARGPENGDMCAMCNHQVERLSLALAKVGDTVAYYRIMCTKKTCPDLDYVLCNTREHWAYLELRNFFVLPPQQFAELCTAKGARALDNSLSERGFEVRLGRQVFMDGEHRYEMMSVSDAKFDARWGARERGNTSIGTIEVEKNLVILEVSWAGDGPKVFHPLFTPDSTHTRVSVSEDWTE